MQLGDALYESGVKLRWIYFPTTSIISLLYVTQDGASAEIAIVGNEGILGISLVMGGNTTPSRAIVQSAGLCRWLMLSLDRLASNELTMTQEAVQSALSPLGLVVEPMVNFFHAQTLAKVKAVLGESAFQSAWEEGSRWPLAEAVRRAPEEEI